MLVGAGGDPGGSRRLPSITRRRLAEFARATPAALPPEITRRLSRHTDREHDVLLLLGRGLSNAEIAERLHIGQAAVKTHVARVLDKIALRDRVHAVVFDIGGYLKLRTSGAPFAGFVTWNVLL
ncbi:helix-turn-helix transcriptional regulator [Streptomyces sp. NPDC006476]|uniref:response regulator transcription factor n=1 Tax=Streptomyces sp. NPDC006476 TaxID=3157175 RepID=UPI0033B94115